MAFKTYNRDKAYAFDYETLLMGPELLAPPSVCFSIAQREKGGYLISDGDKTYQAYIRSLIEYAKSDPEVTLIAHNTKYDLHVFLKENMDMYGTVCELLENGQILDTIINEKLINLTTTGRVSSSVPDTTFDEDAKGARLEYSLADLVENYLGIDIKKDKKAEDAVRKRYIEMRGTPSAHYPKEFKDYAIGDSIYTLDIFLAQLDKRDHILEFHEFDPFLTAGYRTNLDFHLYEYSMTGISTDKEQIAKVQEMLKEELSYEKLNLLYPPYVIEWGSEDWNDPNKVDVYLKRDREIGYLKPSYPKHPGFLWSHRKNCPKEVDEHGIPTCDERCFRRVSLAHTEECKKKPASKKQCKLTRQWICGCPPKIKQAEKNEQVGKEDILDENGEKIPKSADSVNNKKLKNHIIDLWESRPGDFDIMFTDGAYEDKFTKRFLDPKLSFVRLVQEGDTDPEAFEQAVKALRENWDKICVKSEWLDVYGFKDPVLDQYAHRQSLVKLQTTELPRMMVDRAKNKIADIVHFNFDVLKETGRTSGYASSLYPSANGQNIHKMVRTCYKARPDHWILAVDYNSLEFVAAAQRSYDRLGQSVYKKIFDEGWDPHSYLAAQRAYRSELWFMKHCDDLGISSRDYENIYHQFYSFKNSNKTMHDSEKSFYKGYRTSAKPIGLGILGGMGSRMIAHVSAATYKIEMSVEESEEYKAIWEEIFEPEAYMIKLINKEHKDHEFSTKKKPKFKYVTPMGLVRPNCSFTACSNGHLLQSPSAEGATRSVIEIGKACFDPNSKSILKGNFLPFDFVHDENIGDVVADPEIATACANEVQKLMSEALRVPCPDIVNRAEATIMLNWSKEADELRNKDGYLIPWECKSDPELAERYGYVG